MGGGSVEQQMVADRLKSTVRIAAGSPAPPSRGSLARLPKVGWWWWCISRRAILQQTRWKGIELQARMHTGLENGINRPRARWFTTRACVEALAEDDRLA